MIELNLPQSSPIIKVTFKGEDSEQTLEAPLTLLHRMMLQAQRDTVSSDDTDSSNEYLEVYASNLYKKFNINIDSEIAYALADNVCREMQEITKK